MNFLKSRVLFFSSLLFVLKVRAEETEDPLVLELQVQEVIASRSDTCFAVQSKSGAFGSGVMISKEGYLLTAAHVVGSVGEIVTLLQVGADPVEARVERILKDQDVALVRVVEGASVMPFPFVEIDGSSIDLDSIVEVVAFGHASGFRGKRPAPPRFGYLTRNGGADTLISTVRLTAGDSGGPLFDLQGSLIGLHITVDPKSGNSTHTAISALRGIWGDLFDPAS